MNLSVLRNFVLAALIAGNSFSLFAADDDSQSKSDMRAALLERMKERKRQQEQLQRGDKASSSPTVTETSATPAVTTAPVMTQTQSDPVSSLPDVEVVELSEEDKISLQERVKNKVEELQNYMMQLANKEITSEKVKDRCYKNALKLFIGDGDDFKVYDPDLKKNVKKEAARILSRDGDKSGKPYYVRDYLKNLRKSKLYETIEISDVDVVRVDNLQKVGDHYETMAYFCQKYVGYRGDKIAYADMTYKKVRVILNPIIIDIPGRETEVIWNAYLYDIYTVNTRKL